jgi:hypothetical protein
MNTKELKTKAQLNWEVGKEVEREFICKMEQDLDEEGMTELKDLFTQIRQNEYRRGKEDGNKLGREDCLKEELEFLEDKDNSDMIYHHKREERITKIKKELSK